MKRADSVLSGMRPTGRLHLGNYWGALKNYVDLQSKLECRFMVADWHMLTTGYDDTSKLAENVREMVLDWLAAGVDPEKAVVFKQSDVPEHAELALILSMVTPLGWLENNPTWKEQLQELSKTKHSESAAGAGAAPAKGGVKTAEPPATAAQHDIRTYGFLGYPVLQAADVLLYRATKVPVGQDQLPHLELTREIARKFNHVVKDEVLVEPQPLLTSSPKVPGLDGRKMSKSYGNAVDLYETSDALKKKIMSSYTDPNRKSATDPGHPEPCPENPPGCTVFALHKLYANDSAFVERRGDECRKGLLGCVACKKDLLGFMEPAFDGFRKKRESYKASDVDAILAAGARKARETAGRTLDDVRRALRLK